jgi:hypothetical protein
MPALPPVNVDFKIGGLQGVKQAFADFDAILAQAERREGSRAVAGARARVSAEKAATREIERSAKDAERLSARQANESIKQTQRETREKERILEQHSRHHERIVQNSLRWEQAQRERALRQETASVERELQRQMRRREQIARSIGGIVGGGVSRTLGLAGRFAGVAAGLMGGLTVGSAMQSGIKEEAAAGQLVRSSANPGGVTQQDVLSAARATTVAKGINTQEVLGGIDAFIRKTGDLRAGMDLLDELSSVAAMTGANLDELGMTAGDAFNKISTTATNKQSAIEGTINAIRALGGQSRAGAVDIRELGTYGSRLTASAGMFQGDMAQNIAAMGALAQLAVQRGGANNARVATESVSSLADMIAGKADKISGRTRKSVWVGGESGPKQLLRPVLELLREYVVSQKGGLGNIKEDFGESAAAIVKGLSIAYSQGSGGQTGVAGLQHAINQFMGPNTRLTKEMIDEGVADKMKGNAAKIEVATREFHNAVQTELLPLMPGLIREFKDLVPSIQKVLHFFASSSPWESIPAVIGAAIAANIASSAIGAGVAKSIEALVKRLLGGGAPPVPPPPVPSGSVPPVPGTGAGLNLVGGVIAPVAAGVALGAAGAEWWERKGAPTRERAEQLLALTGQSIEAQGGREGAEANVAHLRGLVETAKKQQKFEQALATSQAPVAMFSQKSAEGEALARMLPRLTDALEQATRKLNEFGGAASGAMAQLGSNDGRASQADPARGPIQVGR